MKNAVHFGAGNIGRGFIGLLLSKAGYHVTFIDVIDELVDDINNQKKYNVQIAGKPEKILVENISAIDSDRNDVAVDAVVEAIADADIITTAIGPNNLKYLGEKFDFHGGGADLIFPHHENEIAQSQAAIGDENSFAQYWVHNGFITVNDEKMSKSAGNFFLVEDILRKFPGEVVRFFLLQTHYRSPLELNDNVVRKAQVAYNRLKTAYKNLQELVKQIEEDKFIRGKKNPMLTLSPAGGLVEGAERLMSVFDDAMNDDFNTALAISYMFELSRDVNAYYNDYISGKIQPRGTDAYMIMRVSEIFTDMASTIGIFESADEDAATDSELVDKLMKIIVEIRQDARKNKNWAAADKIRDDLKAAGIILEDTPQGVKWKQA